MNTIHVTGISARIGAADFVSGLGFCLHLQTLIVVICSYIFRSTVVDSVRHHWNHFKNFSPPLRDSVAEL